MQNVLHKLPPRLAERLQGVGVETSVLLLLPPSLARVIRLAELRENARALVEEAKPYIKISFKELEPPNTWREAFARRLTDSTGG